MRQIQDKMQNPYAHVLIIADLEGSSGCWSYAASTFLTDEWCRACLEMSRDVSTVVSALFEAGVKTITIKDFHRTGYNLFSELIDSRAALVSGYRRGPVPGIGNDYNAQAVMFLGMHAASGSDGFLAHTLTSRIARLEVNRKLLAEIELFAASLARWKVRPIFFSGCPVACQQAASVIENINCYPIDKSRGPEDFNSATWRSALAQTAVKSLSNFHTIPYEPAGPFDARVTMRGGKAEAVRLARRWKFEHVGTQIRIRSASIQQMYLELIRLCYLTPAIEKALPLALVAYHLIGRSGILLARQRLKRWGAFG
ncbi:MAG: M55 family metallopeptidase [Desulfobacterales bacterium]|jgi:D-aminopeptidase